MDPKNGSISNGEESEMSTDATTTSVLPNNKVVDENITSSIKPETLGSVSASCLNPVPSIIDGDKNTNQRAESQNTSPIQVVDKGKGIHSGKRKVNVDWTQELHRKFVQAVEKLGVDKAVPSKILELMGTHCLTRHNVASHLQKYRSHWKHILAREAETASWNRRRQTYCTVGGTVKKDMNACVPKSGFLPATQIAHFRPLHVWGYPPTWAFHHPLPPLVHNGDASFWYSYHHQDVSASGMPCSFLPRAFTPQPVPGIPNTSMYRGVDPYTNVGTPSALTAQELTKPPYDFDLSKENLDAAIGDVLSKPWLPLPLGLKPPSIDSVMSELQRQGISKIQPDFYLASH